MTTPLVVILDADDVSGGDGSNGSIDQLPGSLSINRARFLKVEADHLLRMSVLSGADEAHLAGGGAVAFDQAGDIGMNLTEQPAKGPAGVVAAKGADDGDFCGEGGQISGDAGGSAEAKLLFFKMQHRHRRFGAEAVGAAVEIAVDHQVADQNHPALWQVLHQLDQSCRHTLNCSE